MEMPLPGVDELEKQFELRHRAAGAAEATAIRSQDTAFDDGQQSIVQALGDVSAKGRVQVAQSLERHQARRGKIAAELEGFSRQSLPRSVEAAVMTVLRANEEQLKNTEQAEERSARALRAYRLR